ncbi:MAG: hypothetical protein NVS2B7_37290 [Herpetosiphon sp.]
MSHPAFQLCTPRLVLRDLVIADWSLVFALSQAPEVARFQSWLRLPTEAAARSWVHKAVEHNHRVPRRAYNLAIVPHQAAQAVGWIGWGRAGEPLQEGYDVGYALLPSAWGQGYMTETLQTAVTCIFATLGGQQISGECVEHNPASARVMEKAGLQLVRQWDEPDTATGIIEQRRRYTIGYTTWVLQRG